MNKLTTYKKTIALVLAALMLGTLAMAKAAENGAASMLLRGEDDRVFEVRGNEKRLVSELELKANFSGRDVLDATDDLLGQFSAKSGPKLKLKKDMLVKAEDGKIFLLHNGLREAVSVRDLDRRFRGREITTVDKATLNQFPLKKVNLLANNTLLRSADDRIFVVQNRKRFEIRNEDLLLVDHASRSINDVSDDQLKKIALGKEDKARAADNTSLLLRDARGKLFEVMHGVKREVSQAELRREHVTQKIRRVSDSVLTKFANVEDNPARMFDDNSLLRRQDGKIFALRGMELEPVASLAQLRREHAGARVRDVNNKVLRRFTIRQSGADDLVNGVKLRGDGTVDDNSLSRNGADDLVNGVKLRGDGTVDDNLPRHSGVDNNSAGGVDLRGDGTVDDNSPSSGGGASSGGGSSGGGSSGGGSSGGSGGGSSDD